MNEILTPHAKERCMSGYRNHVKIIIAPGERFTAARIKEFHTYFYDWK
jgi:hypothetical protein